MKKKVFRIAATLGSLKILLKGQLKFLNMYYHVVGVASNDPSLEELRIQEGIEVIPKRIDRKINIVVDLISLFKLYFLFKKEKPHIVHSITPKAGLISMIAAYLAGVPHRLHTFTGLIFPARTGFKQKVLMFFDRIICFCATRIYPEGEGVKKDLLKYKITKKNLKVLGNGNVNGIDTSYFNPNLYNQNEILQFRKNLGIQPTEFIFLFVGRIVKDKGIVELITSFREIQKENNDVKLLLVGSFERKLDPLPDEIEKEIKNNDNIILAGWRKDVRPFMSISNIFVLPSYREGFPNTVLQAGAMAKYSIVTDISGSNEIIQENINGKIIPSKDSKKLAEEMRNCIANKSEHSSLNLNYRKIIQKKYDHKIIWSAILEEYRSMN